MAIVELEAPRTQAAYKPPRFNLAVREALWGYGFISLWIVGFLLFTLIPMIATFVFTFTNINLIQDAPLQFVGLRNYQNLFADPRTWDSLLVTLRFAAFALPIGLLIPFSLALLLNSKSLRGSRYFQALFFMPYVIPFVAALFAWGGMLNPEAGWVQCLPRCTAWAPRAPTGSLPPPGSPPRWCSSACGALAARSSSTSPACRTCRPSCTTRRTWTVRAGGASCGT